MNHPTLLQNFQLDYPVTTDSDYTTAQRQFAGPAGFSMDEEDNNRRVGGLGHGLAQSSSIPTTATSSLRYNTQASAMQDVAFPTSPNLLMSDCSDTFSPTSHLYSHYDRMSDYRTQRVPTLQPPAGISPSMQSHGTTATGSSGMMGRSDNCPGSYTLHRGMPSLSGLNDMSRLSSYTSTPRVLESTVDRSQNMMFGQHGNLLMEPVQRLSQPMTDAPPFYETEILHPVVSANSAIGQNIKAEIQAKIHKGFFQVDDKWTCYRRNYFSVSCSFSLHPMMSGPLLLKFNEQSTGDRIRGFAMSISAIVNTQFGETRELVQHTPKRDKQSERKPGMVHLQPCQPPLILGHGSASNSSQHGFALASHHSSGMSMDYNSFANPQSSQPPTQHTFERIQFQKATANNGKRRAQQQYYNLVVELHAEVAIGSSEPRWIKIARRLSHPMVVRGRSPGHYKDGRRDSSTSMGPDGGNGSGDSGGAVLPPGLGHTGRSLMMSYDPPQRGGPHYNRSDYHQMASSHSPLSNSPHISSSSSSAFDMGLMNDPMDSIDLKSGSSMDSYQDNFALTSPDRMKSDNPFRYHLPSVDYESHKGSEDPAHSFSESFDPMSMISHEHNDPSPFLKHPRLTTPQQSSSGYDPIYSRTNDTNSYRFDPVQNAHGLVA